MFVLVVLKSHDSYILGTIVGLLYIGMPQIQNIDKVVYEASDFHSNHCIIFTGSHPIYQHLR